VAIMESGPWILAEPRSLFEGSRLEGVKLA
jgi:hypothetical protein